MSALGCRILKSFVIIPLALLASSPRLSAADPADGAAASELAELRALVLALQSEVGELRAEVAELKGQQPGAAEPAPALIVNTPAPTVVAAPPAPMPSAPAPAKLEPVPVTSRFGINLYGYIKLDAYHDNRVPSHQEVPFWVRQNTPWGDDGFGMTAKESRLGADLRGPTVAGGKVEGKVELDFYADVANPDALDNKHAFKPRSRQLYLQWSDDDWTLLAGQAWEPYVINLPNTLNFTYYSFQGELGLRKTQLRLTRRIDLGEGTALELTGAAIDPTGRIHGGDLDGDAQDDCADSGLPMFASKAVLKTPIFGRKAEFGIAGVYALEEYDTMDKELDVWAVQGGWNIPLTQRLTWKLNAFAGSNLDSLWGGIGQGVNLGMNRAIDAIGGWTQLQFTASDKLSFNLGLSADNPSDDDLSSGGRTLNTTWLLNGYYNFNPSLILGLEFLHGETGYLQAGEPRKTATTANNRVQSSLIYKF